MPQRAVFLDRDGVITREPPFYAHKISDLKLIKNVAKAIKLLNNEGFKVVVISNQSGIARGLYTENDTLVFHSELLKRLARKNAIIDRIYFCPHHPDGFDPKYKKVCLCRKPKIGMIEKAVKEMKISLADSFMIGDKMSDVQTGLKAGLKSFLVLTGQGKIQRVNNQKGNFTISKNLYEAVDQIIKNLR